MRITDRGTSEHYRYFAIEGIDPNFTPENALGLLEAMHSDKWRLATAALTGNKIILLYEKRADIPTDGG